jgi:Tfp pilus assembly protein PilX
MAGSNRGIALISVLWITGLLAVMAASFASSTRTETRLARNQEENAKAEALADAGKSVGQLPRSPRVPVSPAHSAVSSCACEQPRAGTVSSL